VTVNDARMPSHSLNADYAGIQRRKLKAVVRGMELRTIVFTAIPSMRRTPTEIRRAIASAKPVVE
jgi:hypothetical protein